MGCKTLTSPILHGAAFFVARPRGILPDMERKYSNYIKQWRQKAGLSQRQLVARLVELAGGETPDDPDLRIPTTEASLSRIENGKQNFNMATLAALAEALGADEPGWLLDRNPMKGGEVVDLWARLNEMDQARARAVIEAMIATTG